jgi:hypothetical protein
MNTDNTSMALEAALALIALGPQPRAKSVKWWHLSLEMSQYCQGTENANEAAARIVAEAHAVLSDFARTAPGRLPSAVQGALAPWRPNVQAQTQPTKAETLPPSGSNDKIQPPEGAK